MLYTYTRTYVCMHKIKLLYSDKRGVLLVFPIQDQSGMHLAHDVKL